MTLIECVPNISEGRNQATIDAVAEVVRKVPGVFLLDVDPGMATNRTVFTFAGEPQAVEEAAFELIKKAAELIDMRAHSGEHARQGAVDVCPFIPINDVTMEECVEISHRLGKRVGDELGIPIYLYAEAATRPERQKLPDIRAGEYEALAEKLRQTAWTPDYGPAVFNAKAGATVIGARKFLVAYNINLNSKSVRLAKEIAFAIRESGRLNKETGGRIPGLYKHVQATGWYIPEYKRSQVTINILDIDETPVHKVFESCSELAQKLGARVTGSEIVGMVPKKVLLEAGKYFLEKQSATTGVPESDIIQTAILSLGLNDVHPFDPQKKIIEEQFMPETPLASMSIKHFTDELSTNSPAPGGGSVAALAGSLSAALTSMVASLTFEKKGFEHAQAEMKSHGEKTQTLKAMLMNAVDEDTHAFNAVMKCFGMPKKTDDEKAVRQKAIEDATKQATLVPLNVLKTTPDLLLLAEAVVERGNPNSLSDAGVAALMARTAAHGAYYNILINLKGLQDKLWAEHIRKEAENIIGNVNHIAQHLEEQIKMKLSGF